MSKSAYNCILEVRTPKTPTTVVVAYFQVAESEADALRLSIEQIGEAEFLSDIRDIQVISQIVNEIPRDVLEEAAIEVLGWNQPRR